MLLLDEADNFLEADAGKSFQVVTALKRVMDQTHRMFKVIFAGLHNVQRFTKTPNQPLAHLGQAGAIQIGPLEPKSAIALIETPLRDLGYIFGKPDHVDLSLIAHILSYTNYHPGLLQLFGQYLVDHLNLKNYGASLPPYSITNSDIEAVYRNAIVKETIEDRFNITLALDERYKAIFLALILEQWDDKNGFNHLYSPKELLEISRFHWSAGFTEDVTIFKGFLDEMCGLGVLASISTEHGSSKYRLRSPNLVSLMGTQEQILNRMDVISKSQPLTHQNKLESYHAPVDSFFSPLTYAQERVVVGNQSGVNLIIGSPATGIGSLAFSLKLTAKKTESTWAELKTTQKTRIAVLQHLKDISKQPGISHLVLIELDSQVKDVPELIIEISRLCRQIRDKKFRVIVSMSPESAWNWYQLDREIRSVVEEDYLETVVTINRWNKMGIRQLLDQHEPEIPAGEVNLQKIYGVTGGWIILMEKFNSACQGEIDPFPILERLGKDLEEPEARKNFTSSIGANFVGLDHFIRTIIAEQKTIISLKDESIPNILELLFGDKNLNDSLKILEYLKKMSIVQVEPHIHIESVLSRLLQYETKF